MCLQRYLRQAELREQGRSLAQDSNGQPGTDSVLTRGSVQAAAPAPTCDSQGCPRDAAPCVLTFEYLQLLSTDAGLANSIVKHLAQVSPVQCATALVET